MVFVHARNATVRTAMGLIEMAKNRGEICFFQPDQGSDYGQCEKQVTSVHTALIMFSENLHPGNACMWLIKDSTALSGCDEVFLDAAFSQPGGSSGANLQSSTSHVLEECFTD